VGDYRYLLTRTVDPLLASTGPTLLFVMLNPSTADADLDDPTIRRCIGFAREWGMGGIHVINLYAYRATKPTALWDAQRAGVNIVGPLNNLKIVRHAQLAHAQGWPLVAAWGAHAKSDRIEEVLALPYVARSLHCLGTTKAGQPRHPLMLAKTATLEPWSRPKESR
jgi:hypothetical protein